MFASPDKRPALTASDVHGVLRDLYAAEYPNGPPYLFERLLPKLPSFTQSLVRERLSQIIAYETGADRPYTDLEPWVRETLSLFLDPVVGTVHLEIGRDSTLSSDRHSIAHFDTQQPIVVNEMIRIASMERPELLEQVGCVFFDVDGTKTIVDCTSHPHAGKYLEALAEFLCKLPPAITEWLGERNLRASTYSYAGDEFVTILRSANGPVTTAVLNEFSKRVQDAIAADPHLTSFVSFDDEEFIAKYAGDWTEEERVALECREPAALEKLRLVRERLPDRFIPSVSCGAATLIEGLTSAMDVEQDTPQTLAQLGKSGFRLMVALADARLGMDKHAFRAALTDQKLRAFLLRNGENRGLLQKIEELLTQLAKKDEALQGVTEQRDLYARQLAQLRERYRGALLKALEQGTQSEDISQLAGELAEAE